MIANRFIDWEALNRAAQTLYAGQRNSTFVQDPMKLTGSPSANRNMLYPGGPATNPRSEALTPGKFVPGAGYLVGPGAPGYAAGGAAPPPAAPYQVAGYQPIVPSAAPTPPMAGGSTAGQPIGKVQTSDTGGGAAATADLLAATAPRGTEAEPERINDFSKLKPGEQMGWTSWFQGLEGPGGTAAQPKDGAITFSTSMPRMPGTAGATAFGNDITDYNAQGANGSSAGQSSGSDSTRPRGQWRYLGNDVTKYGQVATDQMPRPGGDNAQGAWQWEAAPTAKSLPGLRELILSMLSSGQQVPDSTMTAPSGGMLPNNQGMAPGDEIPRG
jgi:hypothetical protein